MIGCGRAAERYYLPAFARVAGARLVAVADPLSARRELIAARLPGCTAFASAEDLLERAGVAALIVATPPATHLAVAELALRAGVPVLVEKPLAPSMAGIPELEAIAATSRGTLMMGFSRRYWTPVRELREIVTSRLPLRFEAARLVISSNTEAWSAISGVGDPLEDLGPHQLDTLRFVFGRDISAISARWRDPRTIHMSVRLESGMVAECSAAHDGISRESMTVRLGGHAWRMHVVSERLRPAFGPVRAGLDLVDAVGRRLSGRQTSMHRSFELQLASFCRFARTGRPPEPGLADGIAVVRAIEAARRSAERDGREIGL